MYTVIICPDCEYAQLVPDDPETTGCQRCQNSMKFRELKRFFHSEDIERARHARSSIAAQQRGLGDQFDALDVAFDADATNARIEREVLEANNLDKDAMATQTRSPTQKNRSPPDIVRDAIRSADPATKANIIERTTESGLSGEQTTQLLRKMQTHAQVSQTDGSYRLV